MPVIVALHYWAGAGHEFDQLAARLPANTRLLAPDLPGYGGQPVPPGFDFSVAAYADWVAGWLVGQAVGEAWYLVGHSMGGKVALALAARQPAGLRGLLLLSPSPPTPEPISPADRAASLAAYGKSGEAEKTFEKITSRPLPEAVREQVVADNLRTDHGAWNAWLTQGSLEDISPLLLDFAVPCRLLVGTQDRAIAPTDQRRQTLPLLPPSTPLELVPDAGHLLPYEAPVEVAAALTALLTLPA